MLGGESTSLTEPWVRGPAVAGRHALAALLTDNRLRLLLVFVDILAVVLAFGAAWLIRYNSWFGMPAERPGSVLVLPGLGVILLLTLITFSYLGLYKMRRVWRYSDLIFHLLVGIVVAMTVFCTVAYGLRIFYHRLFLLYFALIVPCPLFLLRVQWKHFLLTLRKKGLYCRRVVIVGDSPVAYALIRKLSIHGELGYEIAGVLIAGEHNLDGLPELNQEAGRVCHTKDMIELLRAQAVQTVIFTLNPKLKQDFLDFISLCQQSAISVKFIPDFYELYSYGMQVQEIEGIPLIQLKNPRLSGWEATAKRAVDLALATLTILLMLPLWLSIGLLLALRHGRPVLTRKQRVGAHGSVFRMYSFAIEEPLGSSRTPCPLCSFLHRYSLDEVPQLLNVLTGQMSLVGPRPESPEQVVRYSEWNRRRLLVHPGITGFAQVHGLRTEASTDDKTRYDTAYVERRSLLLDLRILLVTPITVIKRGLRSPNH